MEMPYFDYIFKYLGLDKYHLPETFQKFNKFNIYSWTFNEIIYCSWNDYIPNNDFRLFNGYPTVNTEDCKTLCKLIVLYGSEQENEINKNG